MSEYISSMIDVRQKVANLKSGIVDDTDWREAYKEDVDWLLGQYRHELDRRYAAEASLSIRAGLRREVEQLFGFSAGATFSEDKFKEAIETIKIWREGFKLYMQMQKRWGIGNEAEGKRNP